MSHTHTRRPAATSSTEKFEHKVSARQMAEYDRFMQTADTKSKNSVKEIAAEQYMEVTAEKRGLKVTVTPADKGTRYGPDGDTRSRMAHQGRAEAKAQFSSLSKNQRNAEKTLVGDPNKVLERKGHFSKASRLDHAAAETSQKTLANGGSVSHEVYRTKPTSTGFQTKVTSKTYAAAETGTKGGPVTVRHDPSLKSDGFAEPGRATIPLKDAVRNTGVRSSAAKPPASAGAATAPRSVGTRGAASGQLGSPKSAAQAGPGGAAAKGPGAATPTGQTLPTLRSGGTPSGKF
jgi:hypothetical protein